MKLSANVNSHGGFLKHCISVGTGVCYETLFAPEVILGYSGLEGFTGLAEWQLLVSSTQLAQNYHPGACVSYCQSPWPRLSKL